MAHLLPAAGIQEPKGDLYRFYRVWENTECGRVVDDIPTNIHSYKWTDYREEDELCRQQNEEFASQQQQTSRQQGGPSQRAPTPYPHMSGFGGGRESTGMSLPYDGEAWGSGNGIPQPVSGGWGYCPPIGVDPRSLIRPLDKSLASSTRPTGAPYFAQETVQSCPPHRPPVAKKGGFSYQDWLASYNKRLPPDDLRGSCIPSLCTWCQPIYVDCCPDYRNPWAYSVSKRVAPYYY